MNNKTSLKLCCLVAAIGLFVAQVADTKVLRENTVETADLVDGAVTAAKLGAGVIVSTSIADGAIDTDAIATDAVSTAKLLNAAVDTPKLAADSVTTAKVLNGTLAAADFAAGAVDTAAIGAGAVNTGKLGNDAVTTVKLINAAVETAKLADGAVTSVKIVAAAVQTSKIHSEALNDTTKVGGFRILGLGALAPETSLILGEAVTGSGTIDIRGAEGQTAVMRLSADQGDESADTWTFTANVNDELSIRSDNIAVDLLSIVGGTDGAFTILSSSLTLRSGALKVGGDVVLTAGVIDTSEIASGVIDTLKTNFANIAVVDSGKIVCIMGGNLRQFGTCIAGTYSQSTGECDCN